MDETPHSLTNCIDFLQKAKVLCIGDVILDKFVYGDVDRISPEAPIPVLYDSENPPPVPPRSTKNKE